MTKDDRWGTRAIGLSHVQIDQALSAAFGDPATVAVPAESVLHHLGIAVADTPPIVLRPAGDAAAPSPSAPVGTAGRFELLTELGRGGLGLGLGALLCEILTGRPSFRAGGADARSRDVGATGPAVQ